jgi:hypothetical protein
MRDRRRRRESRQKRKKRKRNHSERRRFVEMRGVLWTVAPSFVVIADTMRRGPNPIFLLPVCSDWYRGRGRVTGVKVVVHSTGIRSRISAEEIAAS